MKNTYRIFLVIGISVLVMLVLFFSRQRWYNRTDMTEYKAMHQNFSDEENLIDLRDEGLEMRLERIGQQLVAMAGVTEELEFTSNFNNPVPGVVHVGPGLFEELQRYHQRGVEVGVDVQRSSYRDIELVLEGGLQIFLEYDRRLQMFHIVGFTTFRR